ncbi:hypothetical protein [Tenacibaculum finnmarkense]|uniref:hypothetical protein n=1 Tax=Tenacibaculum finnmarkense TaxID=2781243 RepID=UPI001EFAAEFE|nr:hypothetical protein [Tenacibaculum finnmarkense]MCG8226364.1 hypothetical protein [Tenacibaculum finnmarkense genomovar finnmarkense]
MSYELLKVCVNFDKNKLKEVIVLCKAYGDIFATISTNELISGYYCLDEFDNVSTKLFENVAKSGRKLSEEEKSKYFTNIE